MDNVFAQVDRFYKSDSEVNSIVQKAVVDKFLRKQAWNGADEETQRNQWLSISIVLTYMLEHDIIDFSFLNIYHYQLMNWQRSNFDLDYKLTGDDMHLFTVTMVEFLTEIYPGEQELLDHCQDVVKHFNESLYINDKFDYPNIADNLDLYEKLANTDEILTGDSLELNQYLEILMRLIGKFYQAECYQDDLSRALFMFSGPNDSAKLEEANNNIDSQFWFAFWDFFFFDYRLISNDISPIYHFYHRMSKKLKPAENFVLRDLVRAKFVVFEILSIDEDIAICHDIFSDNELLVPAVVLPKGDSRKMLAFGHIYTTGVTMMNYFNVVQASSNLRKRIKDAILYQFDRYKCQSPMADFDEFTDVNCCVIRHIISIFTENAQIGIMRHTQLPKPIKCRKQPWLKKKDKNYITEIMLDFGFSLRSIDVFIKLYNDALQMKVFPKQNPVSPEALCAASITFEDINKLGLIKIHEFFEFFNADVAKTIFFLAGMETVLNIQEFDPRYLVPEGFIISLYDDVDLDE